MRIIYCITRSEWGGAQEHLYQLAKDQKRRGNEVFVISGENGELLTRLGKEHIRTIVLPSLQRSINPFKDLLAVWDLIQLVRKIKPKILHVHSSKAGFIGRITGEILNIPTVYTVHGWSFTNPNLGWFQRKILIIIEKFMRRCTKYYIFVSKFDYNTAKQLKIMTSNNGEVIYNGVKDPKRNKKKVSNPETIKIVMIARFSQQKDQITLIRALKLLNCSSYKTLFVGDGPTMADSMKIADELKLRDEIDFLGFQRNVGMFLEQSDVCVLSTNYEGLPISLIEAMSYGLPIVATNVGGNSELIKDGVNGYLTDGSAQDLADKIKLVTSNIATLGNESYKRFIEQFQIETMLNAINHVYEKKLGV